MIWYDVPAYMSSAMFVVMLMTAALQIIIALESGDLIRTKGTLRLVRSAYVLLAATSAVLTAEALLSTASIEGGVFLPFTSVLRWTAVMPALLWLYAVITHAWVFHPLRPFAASLLVPLLYLPPLGRLTVPLPLLLHAFAAAWLAADAAWMFLRFRSYAKVEVTPNVMQHIIRSIRYGICVANRRGWILESNPAFYDLCAKMGMQQPERTNEIDSELKKREHTGQVHISEKQNGCTIRTESGVYFLQRSAFKAGGRMFVQLALSDITNITQAAMSLEQENEVLEQKNKELERLIKDIELEEVVCERERLCRLAHDFWSQRLAVAGLSVDILLGHETDRPEPENIAEIADLLKPSSSNEFLRPADDFMAVLRGLTDMYGKLDVEIRFSGQAVLTASQQETLCAVLREALANAVRHAYARSITVRLTEGSETVSITVINDCLDDLPNVSEGRGLFDMRMRVQQSGGTLWYEKNTRFKLEVSLPKGPLHKKEAFTQ